MNKHLSGSQIRQIWLDFFKSKKHEIIESKSLVPINDPSLLW
ncbi:Alanine--tRNA ligase, partial [Mycoplasmoides gallisepticum]